jgi:hypothetical protein
VEKEGLAECFVVSRVVNGAEIIHELKENGRTLAITQANKEEYIRLR